MGRIPSLLSTEKLDSTDAIKTYVISGRDGHLTLPARKNGLMTYNRAGPGGPGGPGGGRVRVGDEDDLYFDIVTDDRPYRRTFSSEKKRQSKMSRRGRRRRRRRNWIQHLETDIF